MKVALLQMTGGDHNLEKGLAFCRQARSCGADLALFPEMWNCGYDLSGSLSDIRARAVPADGPFVTAHRKLAEELGMAVAVTFLEADGPALKNSVILFDRRGREVLRYAKVHTCDFGEERVLTRGEGFFTADLDTAEGPVRVGAMICFDREFPESARLLMLQGAEVVLVPNACPMEINRLAQLRTRAFENMMGLATANYAFPHPDCNGHSSAFDGMAYREGEPGSRDTLIVEAGEGEGIFLADCPLGQMRAYRSAEAHGNAYRRPDLYGGLTEEGVLPPFVRPDRR